MVGDRQSPPIRSNNGVGLCTICLTGGFYSEFAGTFSANRCVPDTITKKCVDPTGSVMCNLYSITMNRAAIRNLFKVVCTIPLAR